MKKYILSLLIILVFAVNAFSATYYIDYSTGLDSNNGTAKATPWKHHPYMATWSGTYSHSAGDVFIFKGGDTWLWTSGDHLFPLTLVAGGSAGNVDTYTSDPTWYVGGSFTLPILDGGQQAEGSTVTLGAGNNSLITSSWYNVGYIKIDSLQLQNVGYPISAPSGDGSGTLITLLGSVGNIEISHNVLYPHAVQAFSIGNGYNTANISNILVHDNTINYAGRGVIYGYSGYVVNNVQAYNNHWTGDAALQVALYEGVGEYHGDGLMVGCPAGCIGTSTDTLTIGTGSQSMTIQPNYAYKVGDPVIIQWHDVSTNSMTGTVTSYNSSTGALVANITSMTGSGTFAGSTGHYWYAYFTNPVMTNIQFYGNKFDGSWSATSLYYSNGNTNNTLIYNNIFATENTAAITGGVSGYFVRINSDSYADTGTISILNNTFSSDSLVGYGVNMNGAIQLGAFASGTSSTVTIENNIFSGPENDVIGSLNGSATLTMDYNLHDPYTGDGYGNLAYLNSIQYKYANLAALHTAGYENHGIGASTYASSYPGFVTVPTGAGTGNWQLQSNSPAIDAGANLATTFTTDILGNTRQVTWDDGAYDYAADNGTAYTLTVTASTHGTVTDSLSHIDCVHNTNVCSYNYAPGANPVLTATPDSGYNFSGWSGTGDASTCAGTGTCSVTISSGGSVTASYTAIPNNPYNVTVSLVGAGGTINHQGVNQVASGGAGTLVLTATVNNGWNAPTWGGDGVTPYCGGSYSAPTFTSSAVTQDCSIQGKFTAIPILPWH